MVKTPRQPASIRPAPQGDQPGSAPLPVVGIGASAGGLEALEEFFRRLAPDTGMAFVVIQHLDPDHQDIMPELLQRFTAMPVIQAGDGMGLEPNSVYVIPPSKYLSLLDGVLYLLEPTEPRGRRLPIDFFFRALADERHERSVGVILSGMGSDGTLGLRAIKEQAGLALVQEPQSARFDAMPRSAIDAGLADIVAPAGELPDSIVAYARHLRADGRPLRLKPPEGAADAGSLEKILILLRNHAGHDFSLYKKSTVYRRIDRRMGIHQIDTIAGYLRYVTDNPQELNLLFKELLIGVTSFFRDPEAWVCLQKKVLPELLAAAPAAGKAMRAWVAGCSTGEEAYSLAMAFRETLDQAMPRGRFSLQIFATDLDPDAIERARQGYYPADIAADVTPERLARFFVEEGSGYRISKEIREMVVFAPQNVIMDPPFTKLDILCCRNLLIYLGAELQRKLMPLFHYSLCPGGVLFLGSAETVGAFTDLFVPIEGKARLFRRIGGPSLAVDFPSRHPQIPVALPEEIKEKDSPQNLQALADRVLLQQFAPAAVLVNRDGDILYINGRTGKYLEPAAGKANWNIYAMAREGLREELEVCLPKVLRSGERSVSRQLRVGSDGGAPVAVDLTIQPIDEPALLRGMLLLVFSDVPTPPAEPVSDRRRPARGSRVAELELALQQARQETQAIREEMQTSREELKSTNEELQSTNEELQSTNEELTTSKEEMQSLNEELQTVNVELQSKVDELSAANNDMKNLLNSTDLATVFLDGALCVRRFTTQATRIFKLIPGDVGRPLSDIVTDLTYPELHDDAREVLRTLVFREKQVPTTDGRWFMVKIMPYRTLQNVIDGVVITFTDITVPIRLQAELRHQADTAVDKGGR